ncbi:MAG TPA: alkaline phosphatase family protein [Myxococcota bacterium]|nr:alkaline phosphatase family protein [Myxococcota bacterium]
MAIALLAAVGPGCSGRGEAASNARVIVLGFDGMDYTLTKEMMADGRLPNLARLAAQGTFQPLGTSTPPQSPVAWSNFITGMDAGGHGIFDFIHRDPKTMIPYLSTSRPEPSDKKLELGEYQFPLAADKMELLRFGTPFWEVLEKKGIPTTIMRMPANFPPSGTATRELSGMGTPDIIGSYGTFSYYTSDPGAFNGKDVSGGKVYGVTASGGVLKGTLYGPKNPFLVKFQDASTGFTVYIDAQEPVAKIVVGDEERVLKVGEWSDWVPVTLKFIPTQSVRVICRFYLREVRPVFGLYVTPLNLDPTKPAMPISTPASFAAELARATGPFYTQGMPDDTKAFANGVFSADEFLAQAEMAQQEAARQYQYVLGRFQDGLLFYYFGHSDQVSHMMWRSMDPQHPAYKASDARFKNVIPDLYRSFDKIVGATMEKMDPKTMLIVMSDHGFTSWRRAFHLNTWLKENGYLVLRDPNLKDDPGLFANVDWHRTRAYALGLNGLYINLRGREKWGIVDPEHRLRLMNEIIDKLTKTVDPKTGQIAVTSVFRRDDYKNTGHLEIGPDLIVGYAKGTRGSNESALGKVPPEVFMDNTEEWSGDHCMDPDSVPGILVTSRPLKKPVAKLQDLAAAILAEFGIEGFPPRQ